MNITKRLYAYPVLSDDRDDYKNSIFEVDVHYRMIGVNELLLEFDITMDNDELQKLILKGDAEYVMHIECSNTSYRTTLNSITDQTSKTIPINRLNGKLELIALIVLKKDIKGYRNMDWINDYDDIRFDLAKGSILAYYNIPSFEITKDYEEFSNAGSIFKISKRLTAEPAPMDVELDAPQITIGLGTQEYDIYTKFCDRPEFQPILNSMIVLPALVYTFDELQIEDGIEKYEGRNWYISLSKAYEKRGIALKDEIIMSEKTSIQLAQEAMELSVTKALNKLSGMFENNEEEEDL